MRLGYLAAEVPALTMTFVYREIAGLMERGHKVSTYTVHEPKRPATDADIGPYNVLYDRSVAAQVLAALPLGFAQPMKGLALKMRVIGDTVKGLRESGPRALGLPFQALVALRLAKMLQEDQVEHLHIHFAHAPAQIGMYAAQLAGVPFTVMGHANDLFEHPLLLKEKGERSAAFVMISQYNAEKMAGAGVPRDKMPVIRCGLPAVPAQLPNRALNNSAPLIGSLGRLVEKKGMLDLLEAFGRVLNDCPDARLEIIGEGPMRGTLEARISALGLGEKVTLKGAVANNEVMAWLKTLDLFALACRVGENGDRDGIPVALMEAMAAGVPVVSTRLSGVPELIVEGRTGRLADPEDIKGLAEAMLETFQHKDETDRFRQHALDHLHKEFSLDVNLDRLEKLFSGEQK